jgi:CheY-like chemotaxis protein
MIKHILLIDDNEIDNYITKQLLTRQQIAEAITTQSSATEALSFLGELQYTGQEFPGIIFLDIRMPEMDGFGFLEHFAKFPEQFKSQCSIIMLTSSQNPDDIARARSNPHVKEYLQKPITREVVIKLFNIQAAA